MSADPNDPFRGLQSKRPRLMADAAAIERVKKAVEGSPSGENLKAKIIHKAKKALLQDPPKWEEGDLREVGKDALKRLQSLGLAWMLENDEPRYVERARRELDAICGFSEWNPAYFLGTAMLTHAAAIGYDWFHDRLSQAERQKYAAAIIEKGLRPGFAQLIGTPKPAWPTQTTNWNIVCNAGLMIGALALGDEAGLASGDEEGKWLRRVFLRCLNSVPTGLRGYSPDGSWDEGPGYWAYSTEHVAYLCSALQTALGHEFGLGDLPGLLNTGFFRMHAEGSAVADGSMAGKLFNFSDCEETHSGSWCMRWLYWRYGERVYNWVALADNQEAPMDLLWFSPDKPDGTTGIPRNARFRGNANVAMLRGGWGDKSVGFRPWAREHTSDVYVGIRAGINSREDPHGHLDLGSFVLDALQVRWAVDIPPVSGSVDYPSDYLLPGYFDIDLERRFRYYRTSTIGHNTLAIDGFNQPLGARTEIVGFRDASPDLVVAVIDLTGAYPDCLRVRRGFALIGGQHVLIVDELTPKQKMTVAWQMHTRAAVTTAAAREGVVARFAQDLDGAEKEFFAQILEPKDKDVVFTVEEARVTQPREAPNTGIRKLVATLPKVVDPTRICVFLSAASTPVTALPKPLDGPLWRWIEWAGEQRRQKERSRYTAQR